MCSASDFLVSVKGIISIDSGSHCLFCALNCEFDMLYDAGKCDRVHMAFFKMRVGCVRLIKSFAGLVTKADELGLY